MNNSSLKNNIVWFAALVGAAAVNANTISIVGSFPVAAEVVAATPDVGKFGDDAAVSLSQTFSVASPFTAKAIFLAYENDSKGYQDWDMTVTIFEVADVMATTITPGNTVFSSTFTFPAPVGSSGSDTIARLDLSSTVALNASVGTSGYAIQLTEASGSSFNPGFEWLRTGSTAGSVYAGGAGYEDGSIISSGARDFDLAISSVPEPASLSLFAALSAAMLFMSSRRRR